MSERKKFDKAGDTEEREIWNKAGTRLWRMNYTLIEVRPSWRKSKSPPAAELDTAEEPEAPAPTKPRKAPKASQQKKSGTSKPKKKS